MKLFSDVLLSDLLCGYGFSTLLLFHPLQVSDLLCELEAPRRECLHSRQELEGPRSTFPPLSLVSEGFELVFALLMNS